MKEISDGRGKQGAFSPAPGLKEFLEEVKGNGSTGTIGELAPKPHPLLLGK